jgi:hypothetical protein
MVMVRARRCSIHQVALGAAKFYLIPRADFNHRITHSFFFGKCYFGIKQALRAPLVTRAREPHGSHHPGEQSPAMQIPWVGLPGGVALLGGPLEPLPWISSPTALTRIRWHQVLGKITSKIENVKNQKKQTNFLNKLP